TSQRGTGRRPVHHPARARGQRVATAPVRPTGGSVGRRDVPGSASWLPVGRRRPRSVRRRALRARRPVPDGGIAPPPVPHGLIVLAVQATHFCAACTAKSV